MRRAVAATTFGIALVIGSAGGAMAGGKSEMVQVHPGHWGYVQTDGNGGGVPAAHFHNDACFPGCYPSGPGGWGSAVSMAAKDNKGIPNAHS